MTEHVRQPSGAYKAIVARIFSERHAPGLVRIDFTREDIVKAAEAIGVPTPKNLGDVVYSFRYRSAWPESIAATAPEGLEWSLRSAGTALYYFQLGPPAVVAPNAQLAESKVPDATPGIIALYAKGDEQATLARLRYNRLVDLFTGVTCYSLQSHLRTQVKDIGQGEIDELYVGLDRRGAHYVLPVQAKGGRDRISLVQIEHDAAICRSSFQELICRPLGAQLIERDLIAMFEFEVTLDGVAKVVRERHYRLVRPESLTLEELQAYRSRSEDT